MIFHLSLGTSIAIKVPTNRRKIIEKKHEFPKNYAFLFCQMDNILQGITFSYVSFLVFCENLIETHDCVLVTIEMH